jgi:hypothetical protein
LGKQTTAEKETIMSHEIGEIDFVYGIQGQGKDWHGLTTEVPEITRELFPELVPVELAGATGSIAEGITTGEKKFWCPDVKQFIGIPYCPTTFVHLLPQAAWDQIQEALKGTKFKVVRAGMLADRTTWFISVELEEFNSVSRKGEKIHLNFHGALDGTMIPSAELSIIRIVCMNTLKASMALGEKLFRIKQTMNSASRYPSIVESMERAVGVIAIFNKALSDLDATPAKVEDARALYAGESVLAGGRLASASLCKDGTPRESKARNTVDALTTLFARGDGNKGETMGDVLNGFTQYYTRGGVGAEKGSRKNPWLAIASSEFGTNGDRKASFFATLSDPKERKELLTVGRKALKEADALAFNLN